MSAPVAAEVLRELGAERRTFTTVRKAMLWYRDQLAARLRVNRDPAGVGTPTSQRLRDQRIATFAALAGCVAGTHPSDDALTSQALQDAIPLSGERLLYLVAWYENTYGNGEDLARRWNPRADNPRWAFLRWCRITERLLEHRLRAAGLLCDA